jgi:ribokinase
MSHPDPMVIVVGSINVDFIVSVPRLPGAGETVLGHGLIEQDGGKGGNQAAAAARAGAVVAMVAAVGSDDLGRRALTGLEEAGVDVGACRRLAGEHTGVALIVVDETGENQIAVASGANGRLDAGMVAEATASLDPGPGSVCLIGFEISDGPAMTAARWAHGRGLPIILNPAPARPIPDEILACRPILTPNAAEAEALSGAPEPEVAARRLAARSGAPVIVSLGGEGALMWWGGKAERLPAMPVASVDSTGAGDALNGILAARLASGADLHEALRWAMAGAALKTTRAGARAGLPAPEAIERLLASSMP